MPVHRPEDMEEAILYNYKVDNDNMAYPVEVFITNNKLNNKILYIEKLPLIEKELKTWSNDVNYIEEVLGIDELEHWFCIYTNISRNKHAIEVANSAAKMIDDFSPIHTR